MRVLIVTNMYPTEESPGNGAFVAAQVDSLRDAGVDAEVLFIPRENYGRQAYLGLGRRVHASAGATSCDLVHVMYGGVMAAAVTRAVRDRPVLVSFCGSDLLGNRGHLLDVFSGRYSVTASRRAARRATGIIVKSENLSKALPSGVDRRRVWMVPNGIDLHRFAPRDRAECQRLLGWSPSGMHVLFPADPTRPEKRFSLADAALARLHDAGVDVELHVLGGVPHADVPLWLNAAQAIVVTSTHEGSPNAVKEALACNVPVVAVDVGDVRERIAGIDGCFIAAATPEDLATKLSSVLSRNASIRARERLSSLSLERVAAKLLEIYGILTAQPGAGSRAPHASGALPRRATRRRMIHGLR